MTKAQSWRQYILSMMLLPFLFLSCNQNSPNSPNNHSPASANEADSNQDKSAWEKIDLSAIQSSLTPQDFSDIKATISDKKRSQINANISQTKKQLNHQTLDSLKPSIKSAVQQLIDDLNKTEFKHDKFTIQRVYHSTQFIFKYTDKSTGKIGAVDRQGLFLAPPIYDYLFPAKNCLVISFNDLFGLLDFNYNNITLPQYEYLLPFQDNFVMGIRNLYGLIKKDGTIITPMVLDQVTSTYSENLVVARKGDKYGTIDMTTGLIITPFKFDEIKAFNNGKARVLVGEHSFLINKNGECLKDCEIPPWLY